MFFFFHPTAIEQRRGTIKAGNEPRPFEYSSKLDSAINLLNLVREPNVLNLS